MLFLSHILCNYNRLQSKGLVEKISLTLIKFTRKLSDAKIMFPDLDKVKFCLNKTQPRIVASLLHVRMSNMFFHSTIEFFKFFVECPFFN